MTQDEKGVSEKDITIAELKERICLLEKENKAKQDKLDGQAKELDALAEDAARASETRFRSLIMNSSDIIRILDGEGRIVFESPSSEKILGYPPGYTLGKQPFDFIHPDDRAGVRKDLSEVIERKSQGIPTEFRILKAGGEYLWVESVGANMIGVEGVDGIVITTRPIAERKKAEEALREAKAEAELYLDLISHDISNMHQIARSHLEIAQELVAEKGKLEDSDTELIEMSLKALDRSARLITNVRMLQKLRADAYAIEAEDIGVMLSGIVEEYSGVPGQNVIFEYSPVDNCFVMGNTLLKEVFANIIDNAIKHSNQSPTRIAVNISTAEEKENQFHRIEIEDNGPGIPDERKEEIFHRLRRGQTTARGTGLGLYIVQTLAEKFGGHVKVEDRISGDYKKGSRFIISLPAMKKEA